MDIHDAPVNNPMFLMISAPVVYARYCFLKDHGISIDINSCYKVFYCNKTFEKKFGISKEELLSTYNYEEYLKDTNNDTCRHFENSMRRIIDEQKDRVKKAIKNIEKNSSFMINR